MNLLYFSSYKVFIFKAVEFVGLILIINLNEIIKKKIFIIFCKGEVKESEEMKPEWFDFDKIPLKDP